MVVPFEGDAAASCCWYASAWTSLLCPSSQSPSCATRLLTLLLRRGDGDREPTATSSDRLEHCCNCAGAVIVAASAVGSEAAAATVGVVLHPPLLPPASSPLQSLLVVVVILQVTPVMPAPVVDLFADKPPPTTILHISRRRSAAGEAL